MNFRAPRHVGKESAKSYERRAAEGFWDRFLSGPNVLDIGFRGGDPDALPIVPQAIGIEKDYPDYTGLHLPFPDQSQDAVHASHVLEHVETADESRGGSGERKHLREWFRVLRIGGFLVLMVPSAYLYERRLTVPPSRWSGEHLRSYTPATLLAAVEGALEPNTYRVRHLADNDVGYRYDLPTTVHPEGALEIEAVIQRIRPPEWKIES